jgi:hypothetical protein
VWSRGRTQSGARHTHSPSVFPRLHPLASAAVCRSAGQSSFGSRCATNSGLNSDSCCVRPSSATSICAGRGKVLLNAPLSLEPQAPLTTLPLPVATDPQREILGPRRVAVGGLDARLDIAREQVLRGSTRNDNQAVGGWVNCRTLAKTYPVRHLRGLGASFARG